MSTSGKVVGIFVSSQAGGPMTELQKVEALKSQGLRGDRYSVGKGSWNTGSVGKRQVTFINAHFFPGSGFTYKDSRRNIVTSDIELMSLIGRKFRVGSVLFRGLKYCDPCTRPNTLAGIRRKFKEAFHDRGGLIAEVLEGGEIKLKDVIVIVPKD